MSKSARIVVDLPFPVSVNRIWRAGRKFVYRSPQYKDWQGEAYAVWLQQKLTLPVKKIAGCYSLEIVLAEPDNRLRDLGNYEKVLSDFIQSVGLIENDRLCRRLVMEYGDSDDAPLGCRLTIQSLGNTKCRGETTGYE